MSKSLRSCPLIILMLFCCGLQARENNRGYLLIIGGGEKPEPAIKEFVTLCAGKPILVITSASGVPEESGPYMVEQFHNTGAQNVSWLHIDGPAMANADSTVARVTQAGGIFFTGGIQERLMERVGGTKTEAEILKLYFQKRGIIGGTSAGAAVMSRVMITGNELINKDTTNIFITVQKGNVETKRGFGFLNKVIIDQHFAARKRHNRLISVVLENPNLPGIGIDEDTGILVYPDGKFRVYGDGTVIVYDARKARAIRSSESGLLGGRDLKVDILLPGEEYKIDLGKPE
jgi:cyanophycinase